MTKNNNKSMIAVPALLASAAVLLGYVEFLIPVVPSVAGIKLGLGNIAVLLAIKILDKKAAAAFVMLTKIMICSVLFSGFGGFMYSFAGGICSFAAMALLCQFNENKEIFSAVGVSAVGGAVHMAAQLTVAALITSTASVMNLMPVLLFVGTITGIINGIIVNLIEKRIAKYLHNI